MDEEVPGLCLPLVHLILFAHSVNRVKALFGPRCLISQCVQFSANKTVTTSSTELALCSCCIKSGVRTA